MTRYQEGRRARADRPQKKTRLVDKTKRVFAVHGHPCGRPPASGSGRATPEQYSAPGRESQGPPGKFSPCGGSRPKPLQREARQGEPKGSLDAARTMGKLAGATGQKVPVYNFRFVKRAEKAGRGADHSPGGAGQRAAKKRPLTGGPQAPRQASHALPGAPSGGGGAGGRRGEPNGKQSTRIAAQRSRAGPASTTSPGPREAGKSPAQPGSGGRGGAERGRSPKGPSEAPHAPTRCTRAKPKRSKGDRTGSPQRSAGGPAGRRRQRAPTERASADEAERESGGRSAGRARSGRGAPERTSAGAGAPARQDAECAKGPADPAQRGRGGTNARPGSRAKPLVRSDRRERERAARVGPIVAPGPGAQPPWGTTRAREAERSAGGPQPPSERKRAGAAQPQAASRASGAARFAAPVYLILGHYSVRATANDREEWPRDHP